MKMKKIIKKQLVKKKKIIKKIIYDKWGHSCYDGDGLPL